ITRAYPRRAGGSSRHRYGTAHASSAAAPSFTAAARRIPYPHALPFPGVAMLTVLLLAALPAADAPAPLALHPDNPHYFLWRGKPAARVTSGEHYGAVLNLDFDYKTYLKTLQADGLNLTRTFS